MYNKKTTHHPCRLSLRLRTIPALSAERYALKDPSQVYNLNGILHVNQSKGSQEAKDEATLETIVNHLEKSYCGKIAYEFTHIPVKTHPSCMRSKESRSEERLTHENMPCYSLKIRMQVSVDGLPTRSSPTRRLLSPLTTSSASLSC